jgi:hypothetical protein
LFVSIFLDLRTHPCRGAGQDERKIMQDPSSETARRLGAGMSLPDAPDWLGLLRQLAATLPKSSHSQAALDILAGPQLNAHDLEAVAQILRDACPDDAAFEGVVHPVLGKVIPNKTA